MPFEVSNSRWIHGNPSVMGLRLTKIFSTWLVSFATELRVYPETNLHVKKTVFYFDFQDSSWIPLTILIFGVNKAINLDVTPKLEMLIEENIIGLGCNMIRVDRVRHWDHSFVIEDDLDRIILSLNHGCNVKVFDVLLEVFLNTVDFLTSFEGLTFLLLFPSESMLFYNFFKLHFLYF